MTAGTLACSALPEHVEKIGYLTRENILPVCNFKRSGCKTCQKRDIPFGFMSSSDATDIRFNSGQTAARQR